MHGGGGGEKRRRNKSRNRDDRPSSLQVGVLSRYVFRARLGGTRRNKKHKSFQILAPNFYNEFYFQLQRVEDDMRGYESEPNHRSHRYR